MLVSIGIPEGKFRENNSYLYTALGRLVGRGLIKKKGSHYMAE
jgi:hypothetical protein